MAAAYRWKREIGALIYHNATGYQVSQLINGYGPTAGYAGMVEFSEMEIELRRYGGHVDTEVHSHTGDSLPRLSPGDLANARTCRQLVVIPFGNSYRVMKAGRESDDCNCSAAMGDKFNDQDERVLRRAFALDSGTPTILPPSLTPSLPTQGFGSGPAGLMAAEQFAINTLNSMETATGWQIEYGMVVYEDVNGNYHVSGPVTGAQGNVDLGPTDDQIMSEGGEVITEIHAHDQYGLLGFSPDDINEMSTNNLPYQPKQIVVENLGQTVQTYYPESSTFTCEGLACSALSQNPVVTPTSPRIYPTVEPPPTIMGSSGGGSTWYEPWTWSDATWEKVAFGFGTLFGGELFVFTTWNPDGSGDNGDNGSEVPPIDLGTIIPRFTATGAAPRVATVPKGGSGPGSTGTRPLPILTRTPGVIATSGPVIPTIAPTSTGPTRPPFKISIS
jgi:hypothetical protein